MVCMNNPRQKIKCYDSNRIAVFPHGKESIMDTLSLILMIIGALNWGLIGIFQFDVVAAIFGGMSAIVSRIIYTLVGLAGIWGITMLFRRRNRATIIKTDDKE